MPPTGDEAVGIQTELARPSTLPIRRSGIQTTLKLGADGNSEIINGRCAERKEQDPEDGRSYVVLEVKVQGDESDCAESHMRYMSTWANSVDWPAVSSNPTDL